MNNGKICISVSAETASDLLAAAHRAEAEADIIELRFDRLRLDELPLAVAMIREASLMKPLIATFRAPEQGGCRDLTRAERLAFWTDLGDLAWARDLEEDIAEDARFGTTIVSFHDRAGPGDIAAILERLSRTKAEILKIAVTANDICDTLPVWSTLKKPLADGQQIVPIAMGEAGKWTRLLALAHGAFMTYSALDTGSETADGQIPAHDLINVCRVKELDRDTKVYGVIGDPVSSSLSPYMHNAAFAAAGANAVFIPLQVKDLDQFMRRMVLPATREVELNFAGFSVTMPDKQGIQNYLTSIDPVAAKIGAVNTVKIDGDKLTGYNTDAAGFIAPLKQRIPDLKDARVAVLGAGGAARAAVYSLKQEQADVTVFARDSKKAQPLADEFKITVEPLVTRHSALATDILINATPLGMPGPHADKTPLRSDQLSGVKFVYDLVTRRDETPLLREARKAGVDVIGGVEMLISQGTEQFEIWTGKDAPFDVMRQAVLDRLK